MGSCVVKSAISADLRENGVCLNLEDFSVSALRKALEVGPLFAMNSLCHDGLWETTSIDRL